MPRTCGTLLLASACPFCSAPPRQLRRTPGAQTAEQAPANLVLNPGFESGAGGWNLCGGAALIDGNTYPAGETDPDKYVPATALLVVNADGSSPRTVYQTGGAPGSTCPYTGPPGDEKADFIQELTNLSWAPDDRGVVASIFGYLRFCSGRLEGGLARIETIDAASGAFTKILDYAISPEVSRDGRVLFQAYDLVGGHRDGTVWLLDAGAQQPLLTGKGFDDDEDATWMPDGQRFMTIRPTASYRYQPDGVRNQAIMLFDRRDLANPRMLLLADHGSINDLTVSPDGSYILYTLRTVEGNTSKNNIWWLDVVSGATGPVTNDGLSRDADWSRAAPPALRSRVFVPAAARR